MIVGHATFCIVVVYNNVVARLRRTSGSFEEASADLGAHTWQTFRFVTFPSMKTALAAGALLAFALSFDEIIVTTFTIGAGEETLPIWIFRNLFRPNQLPIVDAVAVIVILISIIPVYLAHRLSQRGGRVGRRQRRRGSRRRGRGAPRRPREPLARANQLGGLLARPGRAPASARPNPATAPPAGSVRPLLISRTIRETMPPTRVVSVAAGSGRSPLCSGRPALRISTKPCIELAVLGGDLAAGGDRLGHADPGQSGSPRDAHGQPVPARAIPRKRRNATTNQC